MFNSYVSNTLQYDEKKCANCGMCTTVCPRGVFAKGEERAALMKPEACIECGACQLNCSTGAITVDTNVRFSISILGIARTLVNALDLKTLLMPSFSKLRERLYHSFPFNRKPLNLYFSMVEEIVLSLFTSSYEYFYYRWKVLPEREFFYLSKRYDLSKIEKVIVVGAGAIPFTAIFFSQKIHKPVYAIEKNILAYLACSRLLRRLRIGKVKVVRGSGQLYRDYGRNSLVIIAIQTISKQMVLERVIGNGKCSRIVVIRQPSTQKTDEFESASLDGLEYATIEHGEGVVSFIISNRF